MAAIMYGILPSAALKAHGEGASGLSEAPVFILP